MEVTQRMKKKKKLDLEIAFLNGQGWGSQEYSRGIFIWGG